MSKHHPLMAGALAGVLALGLFTGCATRYRLGSMLPDDIQTVAVPTFQNDSAEPQVEIQATRATIAQLQQDGSLEVVDLGQADTVLKVRITGYELRPIDFDDENTRRADEYRMTLTADVVLVRRSTGEVVSQRSGVSGQAEFQASGGLTSARRSAMPAAAEDLARQIVDAVVDMW